MIEIQTILCPIDFSDYSRHALDHAVAIARRYESTVTALYVFSVGALAMNAPGIAGFEPIVLTPTDRQQLLAELNEFIQPESAPGVPIHAMIREGDAAGEILSQANAMAAQLLVMGTHGRAGFERFLLGSVTEKILRKATCPVLTVPRRHPDAVSSIPVLFKQILCPVDFSDCSMQALSFAMSLAEEADAHLTVLHAMTFESEITPDAYGSIVMNDRESLAEHWRRREELTRQRLRDAVPASVTTYCSVDTMVVNGKPAREILRVAGKRQADLIVIGVQGRGAADVMFFGSTTNQVVREAMCPVLTVRRP